METMIQIVKLSVDDIALFVLACNLLNLLNVQMFFWMLVQLLIAPNVATALRMVNLKITSLCVILMGTKIRIRDYMYVYIQYIKYLLNE